MRVKPSVLQGPWLSVRGKTCFNYVRVSSGAGRRGSDSIMVFVSLLMGPSPRGGGHMKGGTAWTQLITLMHILPLEMLTPAPLTA